MAVLPTVLGPLAPQHLLDVFGVVGVMLILFAETGLLIGIVLPGDSLLFLAGYATVSDNSLPGNLHLPLGWLIVAAAVGALAGAQVGYELGRRAGPAVFRRPESLFFKPSHVERTRDVLDRFGAGRAVVLARFVPIVRTLLNPMAGAAGVPARPFALWNVAGGLLWTVGLILLGHGVGNVDFVRKHIEVLAVLVVLISLGPLAFELTRRRLRHSGSAG
jgi:membrane-associated protein